MAFDYPGSDERTPTWVVVLYAVFLPLIGMAMTIVAIVCLAGDLVGWLLGYRAPKRDIERSGFDRPFSD